MQLHEDPAAVTATVTIINAVGQWILIIGTGLLGLFFKYRLDRLKDNADKRTAVIDKIATTINGERTQLLEKVADVTRILAETTGKHDHKVEAAQAEKVLESNKLNTTGIVK